MNGNSDARIQSDIMNELKWEPRVSHERIGVAVHDGVVTLSGIVPSYAEKLSAEKAAMRVRGVKGVAEALEVQVPGPHQKNDTEIAEAVTRALQWNVWTPSEVKAKVQKGWVTLTGKVEHDFQRQSAGNAVRFLTGVIGVTNAVQVKSPADIKRVKENIEEALKRDAELEAKNVHVDAKDGKVTLSGNVHSFFEKQAAESAAWRAAGVNAVENKLHVVDSL